MTSSSGSVTLDRDYFETLLRKAKFHSSGVDYSTPVNLPMVTIPKVDYDGLLTSAREYINLRRNLYKGGVTDDTLAILVNDENTQINSQDSTTNLTAGGTSESGRLLTQAQISSTPHGTNSNHYNGDDNKHGRYNSRFQRDDGCSPNTSRDNNQLDDFSPANERQGGGYFNNGNNRAEQGREGQFLRNAKRTIQLTNLPESATHADVTEAAKGGMLLDIFLRSQDRTASISFLEENDANSFFRYAKRNDLYIRGKRVEISWAERHFTLPSHVAYKIGGGATRNIVIRTANTKHTEESIRDDLEHIHNLVVISVRFMGKDAHISTNSVHNAMFARTCMMSRSKYKGCKIEWDKDECAVSIPVLKPRPVRKDEGAPKREKAPINRFTLLNVDGAMDSSTDDETNISDMLSLQPDFASGLNGVAV